jgi:pyruvate dehydrogenase E2 component (dihydrolipoamide acetyltransferase)
MGEFRMPSLGADMESGTLVEWRVEVGDAVTQGQVVAEVETDKGLIEIEIFESGIVDEIVAQAGDVVPVGAVLARIGTGASRPAAKVVREPAAARPEPSSLPGAAAERQTAPQGAPPRASLTPAVGPLAPRPASRPAVSPRARKRAAELGVQLERVTGSGIDGAVTTADVERAAAPAGGSQKGAAAPAAAKSPRDYKAAMRGAIAAAMTRSKREIPHYYLSTQIDMSRALSWLETINQARPMTERLLYSVLLLRAVALAARKVPEMNGHWLDNAFKPAADVHVGVAISLRSGGLVAPALHDVDKQALDQLMPKLLDLVKRVRAGVMRSSEVSDATITVTSVGEQGVDTVYGVIYPPQVAIVGFGKIREKPWIAGGRVSARPLITATLSADHRASDGHRGGLFLTAIDHLLQEPERL